MKKLESLSGKEILNIKYCGDLFSRNEAIIKSEYRTLALKWHPDSNSNTLASDVFAHIGVLHNKALELLSKGLWEASSVKKDNNSGKVELKFKDGKSAVFKPIYSFKFELGTCYILNKKIIYIMDSKDYLMYINNFKNVVSTLRYPNDKIRQSMECLFPQSKELSVRELENGLPCLIIDKTSDVYSLNHVYEFNHNDLDIKHCAWIMTRLCNILCLYEYNGIVSNGIDIKGLFVSPKYHTILPYGTLFYATPVDSKMMSTNKFVWGCMNYKIRVDKVSHYSTDMNSAKGVVALLGGGVDSIRKNKSNIIGEFLGILESDRKPQELFKNWDSLLDRALGPRKFITMENPK